MLNVLNVPVYLTTSDKTMRILPAAAYCWNKFWPNQDIHVLGYTRPTFELPPNFTYHSLGHDPSAAGWSNGIINFMTEHAPEFFLFNVDDMMPIKLVSQDRVDHLVNKYCNADLGRLSLWNDVKKRSCTTVDGTVLSASPDAKYRVSTLCSVWRKEAFLNAIRRDMTPWRFELQMHVVPELVLESVTPSPVHMSHGLYSSNIPQHNWKKCICDCGWHADPQTLIELGALIP